MRAIVKIPMTVMAVLSVIGMAKAQGVESNSELMLSINLKPRAVVVGSIITLGDIGYVVLQDSVKKSMLTSIKIIDAPPPGESSEISLNYIKSCLKAAGFIDYVSAIRGPKVIRVTSAQIEIDKAFLKEEYAEASPIEGWDHSQSLGKSLQI